MSVSRRIDVTDGYEGFVKLTSSTVGERIIDNGTQTLQLPSGMSEAKPYSFAVEVQGKIPHCPV